MSSDVVSLSCTLHSQCTLLLFSSLCLSPFDVNPLPVFNHFCPCSLGLLPPFPSVFLALRSSDSSCLHIPVSLRCSMTLFASRSPVPSIVCLTSISLFFHCHFSVLVSPSQISLSFDFHCLSHPDYCLTASLPFFFSCPTGCLTFSLLSLFHLSNAVLSTPFLFVASLLFLLLSMSLRLRHADRLHSLHDTRLTCAAVRLANGDHVVTQCRQRR